MSTTKKVLIPGITARLVGTVQSADPLTDENGNPRITSRGTITVKYVFETSGGDLAFLTGWPQPDAPLPQPGDLVEVTLEPQKRNFTKNDEGVGNRWGYDMIVNKVSVLDIDNTEEG